MLMQISETEWINTENIKRVVVINNGITFRVFHGQGEATDLKASKETAERLGLDGFSAPEDRVSSEPTPKSRSPKQKQDAEPDPQPELRTESQEAPAPQLDSLFAQGRKTSSKKS